MRTWTPGNYVSAFGQRFGTKTFIVDADNTVPVGKALSMSSAYQCKNACKADAKCQSWTFTNINAAFNKDICALNYGIPNTSLTVDKVNGRVQVYSGAKICM